MLLLLALFALPPLMTAYYTDTMTQVAIYSIVTLGLGLLVGRVGLYSLGQLAVLQIGAWVGARLLFATAQPYTFVLIEAGLVTMIIGSLITLPALRLRGLYLALITLMLAGAVTVILATLNFPNGGGGFSGYNGTLLAHPADQAAVVRGHRPGVLPVRRDRRDRHVPARLRSPADQAGPGLGGDQAERARGARGRHQHHVLQALGARAGGVRHRRGGRAAGRAGHDLFSIDFPIQNSITLLAVVLMGGAFTLAGAVIAAFLMRSCPPCCRTGACPTTG